MTKIKLLYCQTCGSVFNLTYNWRECECKASGGQYLDDGLHAIYDGPALPLGFANPSFKEARVNQPKEGVGERFEAFVIPEECDTFNKKERNGSST